MKGHRSIAYIDTLAKPRWRQLKWRRLMEAGFCCEGCGARFTGKRPKDAMHYFDLHHLHYRNFGAESLDDVRILCRSCHQGQHEYAREASQ